MEARVRFQQFLEPFEVSLEFKRPGQLAVTAHQHLKEEHAMRIQHHRVALQGQETQH